MQCHHPRERGRCGNTSSHHRGPSRGACAGISHGTFPAGVRPLGWERPAVLRRRGQGCFCGVLVALLAVAEVRVRGARHRRAESRDTSVRALVPRRDLRDSVGARTAAAPARRDHVEDLPGLMLPRLLVLRKPNEPLRKMKVTKRFKNRFRNLVDEQLG